MLDSFRWLLERAYFLRGPQLDERVGSFDSQFIPSLLFVPLLMVVVKPDPLALYSGHLLDSVASVRSLLKSSKSNYNFAALSPSQSTFSASSSLWIAWHKFYSG